MGLIGLEIRLPHGTVKELECSKQPYRNGTTVLGNLPLLLGVPHDAD
jgi:hypothetical protein